MSVQVLKLIKYNRNYDQKLKKILKSNKRGGWNKSEEWKFFEK